MRVHAGIVAVICMLLWVPADSTAQATPELSYPRLLRKVYLSLRGRVPSRLEYQALVDAPNEFTKETVISDAIQSALDSAEFYERLVDFGRSLLGAPAYDHGYTEGEWFGGLALSLDVCPDGSVHQGRLGIFSDDGMNADSWLLCDDPSAQLNDVEPWWAPGTTVETIGWAGVEYTEVPSDGEGSPPIDCGVLVEGPDGLVLPPPSDETEGPRCGCGPNLIYCARRGSRAGGPLGFDGFYSDASGQRRAIGDEAARLFAHIVSEGRPLTDLVLGTYTVVNQGLQHAYIRAARQGGDFSYLDAEPWWQEITDPTEWREVTVADIYPLFTSNRFVTFDPRVDFGSAPRIPTAGVLTMRGTLGGQERERPRAARWLERLACRDFIPPPSEVSFQPFDGEPATEGRCQVCHALLDPVAMHFKRFSVSGVKIGGVGPWRWSSLDAADPDRLRWLHQFQPNTYLTPVTEVDMLANPDARFLDFAPPGTPIVGMAGDGTIGPLGFAKALVDSGEFDRCMVRRIYGRYGNIQLSVSEDRAFLDKLVEDFLSMNRNVRKFIGSIVASNRFRIGR